MAHITGGGISGNLVRVLPENVRAIIDFDKVPTPDWMKKFIQDNQATLKDVEPVFNLGVGMIVAVSPEKVEGILADAEALGMPGCQIGVIQEHKGKPSIEFLGL